jgi:hypothetical protein
VSAESNRLFRSLRLLWSRLGTARFYVAAGIAIVLALAANGLWHLIAPPNQPATFNAAALPSSSPSSNPKAIARVSPGIQATSPASLSPAPIPAAPELGRAIAITEVTEMEKRGPRGETFIVATIGMTSRTSADKNNIEIRVLFFDVDRNNEMHPTDAQVTYEWLTPVRDWTDPAPKYLAATYLQRRPFRRSPEQLHYGGFVVRVYCDGKLQDERSKPEALIAALRSNTPTPPASQPASVQPSTLSPQPFVAATPTVAPLSPRSPDEGGSLPYGKPIPGKPGFVQSPYDPKFIIDVRGFPPGTLVNDPNTNKPFRVP